MNYCYRIIFIFFLFVFDSCRAMEEDRSGLPKRAHFDNLQQWADSLPRPLSASEQIIIDCIIREEAILKKIEENYHLKLNMTRLSYERMILEASNEAKSRIKSCLYAGQKINQKERCVVAHNPMNLTRISEEDEKDDSL